MVNQYIEKVREDWNWGSIKESVIRDLTDKIANQETDPENGDMYTGSVFLGTVFGITPSGKFYMPWSSNVTEEEAKEDQAWHEAMEKVAEENGMYIEHFDDGIFAQISIGASEVEDVAGNDWEQVENRVREVLGEK